MLPAAAGIKAYYFSLRGGALRGVTPLVRAEAEPCIFPRLSLPHCARFKGHTLGINSVGSPALQWKEDILLQRVHCNFFFFFTDTKFKCETRPQKYIDYLSYLILRITIIYFMLFGGRNSSIRAIMN